MANLSQKLIDQLCIIESNVPISNLFGDDKKYIDYNLDEIIDHFDFIKELCDGTIPEFKFDDFGYNGEYEKWFNDCLNQLYDLDDLVVTTKNNTQEKFLWVG